MNSLIVDARWNGNFGIGRYSREIIQRLNIVGTHEMRGKLPTHIGEITKMRKRMDCKLFYSPGYFPINTNDQQIITLHDLIHLKHGVKNYKYQFFFNNILLPQIKHRKVRVNTVSLSSATEIAQWSGLDIAEILIVPNGLSDEILSAGNLEIGNTRPKNVLYVGNSKRYKNFEFFLNSVQYLDNDWKIDLVGSDIQVPKRLFRENIKIHRNIMDSELCKLYAESSVLAITSLYEGFGMPILEGAYLGTKVLTLNDLPSISEILANNYFLAKNCNPSEFASKIEFVHSSENPISESFRRNLAERYSWSKSSQIVKSQLMSIL